MRVRKSKYTQAIALIITMFSTKMMMMVGGGGLIHLK